MQLKCHPQLQMSQPVDKTERKVTPTIQSYVYQIPDLSGTTEKPLVTIPCRSAFGLHLLCSLGSKSPHKEHFSLCTYLHHRALRRAVLQYLFSEVYYFCNIYCHLGEKQ